MYFFKLKHCGLFPHRMDASDRHNGQRDKRTDEETRRVSSSVRPSLRWSLAHMRQNVSPCSVLYEELLLVRLRNMNLIWS